MTRFHQIAPNARAHDAVGSLALRLAKLASDDGLGSLVFTEKRKSWLGLGPLRRLADWEPAQIALYHHSIGSPSAEAFLDVKADKKILLYHNITPPELAGKAQAACEWGLSQLGPLAKAADLAIGLSSVSTAPLQAAGAKQVLQLPYLLAGEPTLPLQKRPPLVLFVGRIEPFKGVLESFEAFERLARRYLGACFAIVGDTRANPEYAERVRQAIRKAGLSSRARLTGRVGAHALKSWYRRAGVFLTLSRHEGFCVPVVEAMRAGAPVVALRSGAIPETLGKGGLLVDSSDPKVVEAALESALFDEPLRARLDEGRQASLGRYAWEKAAASYRSLWAPSQLLHN